MRTLKSTCDYLMERDAKREESEVIQSLRHIPEAADSNRDENFCKFK